MLASCPFAAAYPLPAGALPPDMPDAFMVSKRGAAFFREI